MTQEVEERVSEQPRDEAADTSAAEPVEPADDATAPAAPDSADSADSDSRRTRGWWVRLGVLVVALLVMVSGLVGWWRAEHDDDLARAETRDAVLIAATKNIETMNTLDYRKIDDGLAAWGAVTTGTLHDQITQVGQEERKLLADQKKVSTGKVVDAAVVDLEDDSATVIAAVEVTVRDGADPAAEPSVKRNRFTADLLKVGGHWKLESLQQVAVNLS